MRSYAMTILLVAMLTAPGMAEDKAPAPEPAVPSGHKVDWYHWADIRTAPYMRNVEFASDGDRATVAEHMDGPQIGGWVEMIFPKAVPVTALRFQQAGNPATAFELRADLNGTGVCDTVVATGTNDAARGQWMTLPVDKVVHRLRLTAMSGTAGYRSPYPAYREIELYAKEPVAVQIPALEKAAAGLTAGAAVPMPALTKRRIAFTPCIDIWHAGLANDGKNLPEDLEQFEGFRTLVARLKDGDADGVRLFLETACCENRMPWPSALCPHADKDVLRPLVAALHKNGLTASIFLHAWISPIQREGKQAPMPERRWDYPYEQSDLILSKGVAAYTETYPCVICDDDFRSKWTGILKEAVDRGVDGVYVMPDEYYFKGHNLEKVKCPACEREFKKRYGFDSLPKPGAAGAMDYSVGRDPRKAIDSDQYRKWKLFEYEKLAELFDGVAADLKKANPNLVLVASANPASPLLSNCRLEHGIALDVIGRGRNFTHVQMYASVPLDYGGHGALARRMRGEFPNAELSSSIQSLEFNSESPSFPLRFHGYLLPHVMNGARRVDLYRLNYVTDVSKAGESWWPTVKKGIGMMRLLDQWDVVTSASSADTCLLFSRASEDWWQVKAQAMLGGSLTEDQRSFLLYMETDKGLATAQTDEQARALNFERFRGMYANKCAESLLIENGIQYDFRCLESPGTLTGLEKYKLLILPFGYSMSKDVFDRIRKAVEGGTKLLVFDQLAPTDEYGNAHPQPLLQSLIGNKNVTYIKTNLAAEGTRRTVRDDGRRSLYALLGEGSYFNRNGARVEYLTRRTSAGMLIYLANWEFAKAAEPVLGLAVPDGNYTLTLCSSLAEGLSEGQVGGKTTVPAAGLKKFAVQLAPGEVKLVRVERAP